MYNSGASVRLLDSKPLMRTPFLSLNQVTYADKNGVARTWYGVSRENKTAAVEIAAITTDNELIFVKQYRPLVDAHTLELPAGLMDVPGESARETAIRELLEETGYAGSSAAHVLGEREGFIHSSGLTDERLHLVLITDAVKVAEPYEDEGTVPVLVPLNNALRYLGMQRFTDIEINYQLFGTICLIQNILEGAYHV